MGQNSGMGCSVWMFCVFLFYLDHLFLHELEIQLAVTFYIKQILIHNHFHSCAFTTEGMSGKNFSILCKSVLTESYYFSHETITAGKDNI